jgi:hypothetical protein
MLCQNRKSMGSLWWSALYRILLRPQSCRWKGCQGIVVAEKRYEIQYRWLTRISSGYHEFYLQLNPVYGSLLVVNEISVRKPAQNMCASCWRQHWGRQWRGMLPCGHVQG